MNKRKIAFWIFAFMQALFIIFKSSLPYYPPTLQNIFWIALTTISIIGMEYLLFSKQ